MKTKNILSFVLCSLFILSLSSSLVSANFWKQHIYWTLDGFENVDSVITRKCGDYLLQVIEGDLGADATVLHYPTDTNEVKSSSYLFTHQRNAYELCKEEAGGDDEIFCICIGHGLHLTQDYIGSHGENAMTSTYLAKFGAPNILGHMTVEKSAETTHMNMLKNSNNPLVTKINYYNDRALDLYFEYDSEGNLVASKYLEFFNDYTGLDLTQDFKLIRSGYQGEGLYNTVYKDKMQLPFWVWGVSIGLMIIGTLFVVFILIFANTWWKYLAIIPFILVFTFGFLAFISFLLGTTWQFTNYLIDFIPHINSIYLTILLSLLMLFFGFMIKNKYLKFAIIILLSISIILIWIFLGTQGFLKVSEADVLYYDNLVKQATYDYLSNGILKIDDASGLSYYDNNGNYVEGALIKAQNIFKWITLPFIILIIVGIEITLIIKSFDFNKRIIK